MKLVPDVVLGNHGHGLADVLLARMAGVGGAIGGAAAAPLEHAVANSVGYRNGASSGNGVTAMTATVKAGA